MKKSNYSGQTHMKTDRLLADGNVSICVRPHRLFKNTTSGNEARRAARCEASAPVVCGFGQT